MLGAGLAHRLQRRVLMRSGTAGNDPHDLALAVLLGLCLDLGPLAWGAVLPGHGEGVSLWEPRPEREMTAHDDLALGP